MLKNRSPKILAYIVLLFVLSLVSQKAEPSPPHFQYHILSHHLNLQIDPAKHLIKAEDRLTIELKDKKDQTLSLLLDPGLKVLRITELKTGGSVQWSETFFSGNAKRLDLSFKGSESSLSLSVVYEGEIYDPITKEKELQFIRGDRTSGLIAQEGVYLSPSAHWFPDLPDSAAAFEVEVLLPEAYRVVTQGELRLEERRGGHWYSHWVSEKVTEGLALVAGRYSVRRRNADGIRISTFFLPEEDRFSDIFLDAAEAYLKIYTGLLGPYPYGKFDIVQSFFSSGFSFPSFTLLAPEAIRQGREFLRPGTLDHEIVHAWWGHDVRVKAGTGNWAEALTTYCSNYYLKELKFGEEAARRHRQDQIQKYAVRVSPSEDYALREFISKENERDGEIGYGKGSMVFHMLRRIVGKDLFFESLRGFHERFTGKQASWQDIEETFEKASGKRLDRFFDQWLERPGGPKLKLGKTGYQITSKGYLISGEVVQEGETYELLLPVKVDDGGAGMDFILHISKERTPFSFEVPQVPSSLTFDPNCHLFRRLFPEEIVPCLNAFLESEELISPPPLPSPSPIQGEGKIKVASPIQGEGKTKEVSPVQGEGGGKDVHGKVFVLPNEDEDRKIYGEIARMAEERKGGEILTEKEMTEEKVRNSSLMLLGESWKNPVFSKLLESLPKPIRLDKGSLSIDGKKVKEDESLLLTYPHPFLPGGWVTIYFGASEAALSRARYVFFYGWDSYILFEKGRPEERGRFSPVRSYTSCDFLSAGK